MSRIAPEQFAGIGSRFGVLSPAGQDRQQAGFRRHALAVIMGHQFQHPPRRLFRKAESPLRHLSSLHEIRIDGIGGADKGGADRGRQRAGEMDHAGDLMDRDMPRGQLLRPDDGVGSSVPLVFFEGQNGTQAPRVGIGFVQ